MGSVSIGTVTWVVVNRTWFAGQGGQEVEQAAEAAVGPPGRVALYDALAWAAAERRSGVTGLSGAGGFWSGEGERRPGLARVSGEVAGEHAGQHVGADAFFQPAEDGPQV